MVDNWTQKIKIKPNRVGKFTYYGGHQRFPIEGMMATAKGKVVLYDDAIFFYKEAHLEKNTWIMKIPLSSIQLESFGVHDKVTGQFIDGVTFFGFDFSGQSKNKTEPRLIISHVDENNVLQKPEFTIVDKGFFKYDDTAKWGRLIYDAVTPLKKSSPKVQVQNDDDSPIEILKKRYARGELSKDEFENMKKDLET